MTKNHYISLVAVAILVGLAAFYGGTRYANAAKGNSGNPQFQGAQGQRFAQGQGARRTGAVGGGALSGEILSVDDQSVTVKLPAGGSKIAFYSASTKISKTVDGTVEDLKVGEFLMITGQDNSDGTVTAQMIQLRNRPLVNPDAKTTPQTTTPPTTK